MTISGKANENLNPERPKDPKPKRKPDVQYQLSKNQIQLPKQPPKSKARENEPNR